MPIRASEKARYPKDWKVISLEVRARSGGQCECVGECGLHRAPAGWTPWRCIERNGREAFFARGRVVLTVAHLDHTPENNGEPGNRPNLKAMCQRCHLVYDLPHHKKNAHATREAKSPQLRLDILETL